MFRFANPDYLWLLLLIAAIALMGMSMTFRQMKRRRSLVDDSFFKYLVPDYSKPRKVWKFCLRLAALMFVIIALARPQAGMKIATEKREGIQTIIALDISNSMLAEDVAPSRLEKSKLLIEHLVDRFDNDRIGLIVFAGESFVQLPVTQDYVSAKMFLHDVTPSLIESQGTDIGGALRLAVHSFSQNVHSGRAVIVITDGEDHEGRAEEMAKAAQKEGVNVFILGVGTTKGAPIPLQDGGYMEDNDGHTVLTKLNEQMCKDIASAGKGVYIHVDNATTAEMQLDKALSRLQDGDFGTTSYTDYDEQYQTFVLLAVLMLIIDALIMPLRSKRRWWTNLKMMNRKNVQTVKAVLLIMVLSMSSAMVQAQTDRGLIRQGNRAYRSGSYAEAETAYRKAVDKNPDNPQAHYDLGCSLLKQNNDKAADAEFQKSAKLFKDPLRGSQAHYNMGIIDQKNQNYKDAIKHYEDALKLNPKDEDARYNLELCKKLLKQQQQQQKHGGGKNGNNDKKDKDKQNQDKNNKNDDKQQNGQDKQKQPEQQQKKQQQQQEKISRDNAEQMLNAVMQKERETQDRLKKAMQQPSRRHHDKKW
jgi:Ca-activated chloride channel family protein